MDYDQYSTWSENARPARIEYLEGKLMAEEFLRRVDVTQELTSYETDKVDWWRRLTGSALWPEDIALTLRRTIQR